MPRADSKGEGAMVSKMAIVDTFTKLIFGEDGAYSVEDLRIIQAFRSADTNVALDSHRDMGGYLRAMGVREMIQLVPLVQHKLMEGWQDLPDTTHQLIGDGKHQVVNRRAH